MTKAFAPPGTSTDGAAVADGVVTLSGEVEFYAKRAAAKRAALRVRDVTAVVNDITVHPESPSSVSEHDIAKAVDVALRSAINVPDTGQSRDRGPRRDPARPGDVGLPARSWAERRQADFAAWSSPHVSEVYNHIIVRSA
jgi:hypothetical protein